MIGYNVWNTIDLVGEKLLLKSAKPDSGLVEEALSFNAKSLHQIEVSQLRKYLVVLGQYLITLQYTENHFEAEYQAWNKSLDSYLYKAMREGLKIGESIIKPEGKTLSEKRAWILDMDVQAAEAYSKLSEAEAKKTVLRGMSRPVEQYINTLKKEVDARNMDRRISNGKFFEE